MVSRFGQEGEAGRKKTLKLSQSELTHLKHSTGKFKPKGALEDNGDRSNKQSRGWMFYECWQQAKLETSQQSTKKNQRRDS